VGGVQKRKIQEHLMVSKKCRVKGRKKLRSRITIWGVKILGFRKNIYTRMKEKNGTLQRSL